MAESVQADRTQGSAGRRTNAAKKTPKRAPTLGTEDEERAFWECHDTADYVDWSRRGETVFPDRRPARPRRRTGTPKPVTETLCGLSWGSAAEPCS